MTRTEFTPQTIIPFLADIFERCGAWNYLGEPVTTSEHMRQTAAQAEQAGAPDELVAAALLHDIGHFTSEFGTYAPNDTFDRHHDAAGARSLATCFPPMVSECVRLHVAAKRYLCAVDPDYFGLLTPASVHSLELQGGPMSDDEVRAFEAEPYYREAVDVRKWDDCGKTEGVTVKPFSAYTDMLQSLVDAHAGFASKA
jgi:[1-hydroxy-2-(trimethylamino)ethyl]phosphonate dioxygenase